MGKRLHWLQEEITELLPPTIFFFFAFHLLAFSKALALKQYGITVTSFATATLGALVVGKAVLIADKVPFINRFPDRPLIYNVTWKTFVYIAVAFVFRYLEHLFPLIKEHGSAAVANQHLLAEVEWPHFWLIQLWLLVLLLGYTCLRELVRAIGRERFLGAFFRTPGVAGGNDGER